MLPHLRVDVCEMALFPPMKLASDEIHLWLGSREVAGERWRRLDSVLSPDERDRGGRLRRSEDRRRFVAARGLLRHVLAAYAGAAPEQLRFTYGPMGRPRLAGPHAAEDLSFNLSHARHVLLVGVARGRPLGVDLEPIRPLSHLGALQRRVFSEGERETIDRLPAGERLTAFFSGWTRKEAFAKAVGDGVWASLGRVEVSVTPGDPPRLLKLDGSSDAAAGWSLFHVEPAPGFIGAVAAEGRGLRLSVLRLDAG